MMKPEAESVAYHEAGHVAAALELGIRIGRKGVTIAPDHSGHTQGWAHIHKGFSGHPEHGITGRMRLKAENRIIVLLAGMHAEMSFAPSRKTRGESNDLRQAWGLLEHFCASTEEVQAYLDLLNIRTKQLVASDVCQVRIEALANALLEKRRLTAGEVMTIAQSAVDRWIDDKTSRVSLQSTSNDANVGRDQ